MAEGNNQLVTVFMLTYNRRNYLKLAIDSVLNQTYKNFTFIILDNCSVDDTADMVKSIEDPRLIYCLRESTHEKPNTTFGCETCITKYFIILHDDDLLEPTYLEEVLYQMEHNDYDVLTVAPTIIDGEGRVTREHHATKERWVFSGGEFLKQFYSDAPVYMIYPSAIYRTAFYQKNRVLVSTPEAGPAGDVCIWLQTERFGGTLCRYEKPLIRYRVHSTQDSQLNAGFMSLHLLDFLLNNPYYAELLKNISWAGIHRTILTAFNLITRKYALGYIDYDRYGQVFQYKCLSYIRETTKGKVLYGFMRFLYKHPKLTKTMLTALKKI